MTMIGQQSVRALAAGMRDGAHLVAKARDAIREMIREQAVRDLHSRRYLVRRSLFGLRIEVWRRDLSLLPDSHPVSHPDRATSDHEQPPEATS